jgi:integrase
MKLTAANVARLQLAPGERDRIYFDDAIPGFGVRLREGGAAGWVFQYKLGAKQRRMALGRVSAINAARARESASELHAKVKLGGDPAAEKLAGRIRAADTFGALVAKYLEHQKPPRIRKGSYLEVERHLELHGKHLHALPLASVDQRVVSDRLRSVAKDSGDVTANRVRSTFSAMFSWAMGEGLAPSNPVANTNKREERSRDRVLSDDELRLVWTAAGDEQYGAIVKLLMLTGQRENEIAGLCWSEIDFDRDVISLPAERTKNGRAHEIPMGATVRAILDVQPRRDERDLVFGYGSGPFSGWGKSKAALDARITEGAERPLPHWVLHDLRRTCATRMADIGILPHVIEAVLNHVSGHKGGIAGIYNRALYTSEKAQAIARWDTHLAAVVAGKPSNVTALRTA